MKWTVEDIRARFIRPLPAMKQYEDRLDEEFDIITRKGFVACFMQVADIIDMIRERGIPHVLRGSGASSLVCYLLGITNIDPVKEGMALARFMNDYRDDQPDIDIDVPHWVRPQLLEACYERWPGRVARISNDVRYRPKTAQRTALKEAGVKGRIPRGFKVEHYFTDQSKIDAVYARASELEGEHRHWSLHCGGLIIYPDSIPQDLVLKDNQISLTKYDVEEQNLIKIDLLCNRGLSQLWELDSRPLSEYDPYDEKTAELLCRGDVLGLTQAESPTMKKCLTAMQPQSMYDVALALALIRPAASLGGRKNRYLRGRGGRQIIYDDDSIYYIAERMGCTMGQADQYRRAFKSGKSELMDQFYDRIRGEEDDVSKQLVNLNSYAFCKGHALAYGQMVWALAWHKTRNPERFWRATLKHVHSSYRPWVHKREAIQAGVFVPHKNWKKSPKDQLLTNKWWTGEDFFPGMQLFKTPEQGYVGFRGLVAASRRYKRRGLDLHFVTIGFANGEYVDVVVDHADWKGNGTVISGCGKLEKRQGSYVIQCEKMWKTWL
jgi:DNA polymerase III alpha subunit